MIKLKDLYPQMASFQQEKYKKINEAMTDKFNVHTDPDQTERGWSDTFEKLAKGHPWIDYGPRETDMYDWIDRRNYSDAINEYNKHMNKIAKKLNSAVADLNKVGDIWYKTRDKYRDKDRKAAAKLGKK